MRRWLTEQSEPCVCVGVLQKFEADRRSFMIAINSIGTHLSLEEKLKLCPKLGRLYPDGQISLAEAEDYEQIRAVASHYSVSM